MAKFEHTPGPWEFDPETGRVDAVALRKPTGTMFENEDGSKREYIGGLVALPYGCHAGDYKVGKCDANARLIAAAPDMLAACGQASFALRELLPNDPDAQMTVRMLQDAIAKATGEAA